MRGLTAPHHKRRVLAAWSCLDVTLSPFYFGSSQVSNQSWKPGSARHGSGHQNTAQRPRSSSLFSHLHCESSFLVRSKCNVLNKNKPWRVGPVAVCAFRCTEGLPRKLSEECEPLKPLTKELKPALKSASDGPDGWSEVAAEDITLLHIRHNVFRLLPGEKWWVYLGFGGNGHLRPHENSIYLSYTGHKSEITVLHWVLYCITGGAIRPWSVFFRDGIPPPERSGLGR